MFEERTTGRIVEASLIVRLVLGMGAVLGIGGPIGLILITPGIMPSNAFCALAMIAIIGIISGGAFIASFIRKRPY